MNVHHLELFYYVASDYGFGIAVEIPGRKIARGLRRIALAGFPPLRIGLVHPPALNPVALRFTQIVIAYAAALAKRPDAKPK